MKYAILLPVLLLTSYAQAAEASKDEMCKRWGDLAVKIMDLRQSETPMNEVMKVADVKDGASVTRQIITWAYEQPSYSTKSIRERAIAEFRNRIELQCYKSK
ncbi:hypothetical protein ECB98_23625 [Brucellaceae bacterium VT-16-1752]|nr:hypothetical protein ECB98_23625 [Brucellaceae bacterium VT-16-1752]